MKKLILAGVISAMFMTQAQANSEMNVLCQYDEMDTYAMQALMFSQIGLPMEEMFSDEEWAPGQHDSMREMVRDAYSQPTNLRPGLQAQNDEAFVNKWQNYCDRQVNAAELEFLFEIFSPDMFK